MFTTSVLAIMSCRLPRHFMDLACSRARAREGSKIEINRAMMAMTTNSSTSVKACDQ